MRRLLLSLFAFFVCLPTLLAAPLPPEAAFRMAPPQWTGQELVLDFTIAPGYYLYKNRFQFKLEPQATVGSPQFPPAQSKTDPYQGQTEIFHDRLTVRLPVTGPFDPSRTTVIARLQGCSEAGICYPPYTWKLPVSQQSALTSEPEETGNALRDSLLKKKTVANAVSHDESTLQSLLQQRQSLWIVLTFIGLGLGLSLTACLYPLIPIVSGIILAGGQRGWRGLTLSLAYVQGLALTYAVAGVLAGLSGQLLSRTLQSVWVQGAVALLFAIMALAMFDVIRLQLPANWQTRLTVLSNRLPGGHVGSVLLMGAVSALIIGPCVTPPLSAALTYIAQTGNAGIGGLALYSLGLGLGLPLLLIGVAGDKLLPHAGAWMNTVRRAYGVALLGMALYFARTLLPPMVLMLAWSALFIGCGMALHAIDPLPPTVPLARRLAKALGLMATLTGAALLIGALAGNRDPWQPLKAMAASPATNAPLFQRLSSPAQLEARRQQARGQPVVIDVFADWCPSCVALEHETFKDARVAKALAGFTRLQLDISDNSDEQAAWLKQRGLFAPPILLFFDRQGRLVHSHNGPISAEALIKLAQRIR